MNTLKIDQEILARAETAKELARRAILPDLFSHHFFHGQKEGFEWSRDKSEIALLTRREAEQNQAAEEWRHPHPSRGSSHYHSGFAAAITEVLVLCLPPPKARP
jgi:hypothetical protein